MPVKVTKCKALARNQVALVSCWVVEISRHNRELAAVAFTADVQVWNATRWWRDREPRWWRHWWSAEDK